MRFRGVPFLAAPSFLRAPDLLQKSAVMRVIQLRMLAVGVFCLIVAMSATNIISLLMLSFILRRRRFSLCIRALLGKILAGRGAIASLAYERKFIAGLIFFGRERQPVIPGLVRALAAE